MSERVSLDDSYDDFPRIEEAFQLRLDESLDPRGPSSLWDELARLEPMTDDVVLDIGCGEGDDAVELAQRFGVQRVHGVDPLARHVELGAAAAEEADLGDRVAFSVGTAEATGLPDASVDLAWAKECLMYADLDAAFVELRRVLRPAGRVLVYQVFTGSLMSDDEAEVFWRKDAEARSVRPEDLERAATDAGFEVAFRSDLGSEWGEYAQEHAGAGGRRLVHAARLLRDPARYIAEFGESSYRIMLGDCLWHVYRMIGKLHGAVFGLRAP